MTTYRDGQSAPYGLFVSFRPLDTRFVGAAGEELEGIPGAHYKRLPNMVAVAMAPVLGGLFVVLFPLVVLLVSAAGLWRLAADEPRAGGRADRRAPAEPARSDERSLAAATGPATSKPSVEAGPRRRASMRGDE